MSWDKRRSEAGVSVSAARATNDLLEQRAPSRCAYLPLAFALMAGFLADGAPELLPVFRGLRVMLGVVAGTMAGLLVLAIVSAFTPRRAGVDDELEQKRRARRADCAVAGWDNDAQRPARSLTASRD